MLHPRMLVPALALLLAARALPSLAQADRGVPQSDVSSISALANESAAPPLRSEGGISYRTGGVGKDERDALLLVTKGYALKLVFAGRRQTEFIAEVNVDVLDQSGRKIISAADTGPLFLADLPAGTYRIVASFRGDTQEKNITLGPGKQTQLAFYW